MDYISKFGNTECVAVLMLTYNHEKYISEAINGVLQQVTQFNIKLIIGEDSSTDNTKSICWEYARKYPEIIQVISTAENNIKTNVSNVWAACAASGATYIAMCEGDDYWTDPRKLQKQVTFLNENPDFSFCFSGIDIVEEEGTVLPCRKYVPAGNKDVFTIEDFILSYTNIAHTATLLFRNTIPYPMPDFYYDTYSGDVFLSILLADKGKAKYFNEKMAVYRNHGGGITKTKENIEKGNDSLIALYKNLDRYLNYKYRTLFRRRLLDNAKVKLVYGAKDKKGLSRLTHYIKTIPGYLKYSEHINLKEFAYYHVVLFFPFIIDLIKNASNKGILTEY